MTADAPIREDLSELERARAALRVVEQLGDLTVDERLEWIAKGSEPARAQAAYLRHASACALVSIAASLERLVAELDGP